MSKKLEEAYVPKSIYFHKTCLLIMMGNSLCRFYWQENWNDLLEGGTIPPFWPRREGREEESL